MRVDSLLRYVGVLLHLKRDREAAFSLLTKFGRWVLPDYRFTYPQMTWWQDEAFNSYLQSFGERTSFNSHRRWMLVQLLRLTEDVPGDTAECGVYRGCGSWPVLCASKKSRFDRVHHIFDSFEGLSEPTLADGKYWSKGDMSVGETIVEKNLGKGNYRLYKGWIPTRFADVADRRFSFVHVDVDLYQPTRDSIAFFYDRLNQGGVFLCDDYGFDTCPGATKAMDEFLAGKPEKTIALPDGGGFFLKGSAVSEGIL